MPAGAGEVVGVVSTTTLDVAETLPSTATISFTSWLPKSVTKTSPLPSPATLKGWLKPLPSAMSVGFAGLPPLTALISDTVLVQGLAMYRFPLASTAVPVGPGGEPAGAVAHTGATVVGGISALCVPGWKLINGIVPMPSMFAVAIAANVPLGRVSLCNRPDGPGAPAG